jgi:Tol biopolymer transport system component
VASAGNAGHLLYTFRGALYALPFDPDKVEARGTAVPVLSDVISAQNVAGKFDVSNSGTLLYQKGSGVGAAATATIQWIDSTGKMEPLLAKPGGYYSVRFSPDGKRLAMAVQEGANQNIQVYEWQSGRTTNLTFGGATYSNPVWTPDGQNVVFQANNGNLYSSLADGSGQPQVLTQAKGGPQVPWSFSPDGKRLAFMQPVLGKFQLWTVPIDQQGGQVRAGTPEQFLRSESIDVTPKFSPDGRWLAYESFQPNGSQIFVRPSSGQGGQWVVSTSQQANRPVWSRTGRDLLYVTSENQVMAVSYTAKGDTFVADKPRVWLAKFTQTEFDVSPDGKRLVAIVPTQSSAPPQLEHEVVFLQNFFDELRRRAPGSR